MSRSLLLLLLCAGLSASSPSWRPDFVSPTRGDADESYRLSRVFVPISYNISLIPYFETPPEKAFTFDGHVKITFTKTDESFTNYITMHSHQLTIVPASVVITDDIGTNYGFVELTFTGNDRQFLNIRTNNNLQSIREYYIEMDYTGILNDNLEGFYRSKVVNRDGSESWMGVTQFEQTYARQAFPCFDEPGFKATFALSIAHAPNFIVQANMPIVDETPLNNPELPNWTWSIFGESVVMSSYLVAFSVNQFSAIVNPGDNRFRVYAKGDSVAFGVRGVLVAPQVISHMEAYTGHVYSLPKLDQIAVPTLSFGAMENWGLVTYREPLLLFEEGVSTTADWETVTTIVTHELAHQWFGNIVSPTWWRSTWLNEGFATYFEYYVSGLIEPTWEMEAAMVEEQTHAVLQSDSLNSTHPLLTEVDTPASATAAFDQIAYNKGGSIVRMIVSIMGEDNFKQGINAYLTDMQFASADASDLWRNLAPFVPVEVLPPATTFPQLMEPWNSQPGYPVLTVIRDYNPVNRRAAITQERFIMVGNTWNFVESWDVPFTYTTQAEPDFDTVTPTSWHPGSSSEITIVGLPASSDEWVIFNVKQVGYYRVNYDVRNWFLISFAMSSAATLAPIHPINRAQVMDDALALARGGQLDYETALGTTSYLALEQNYAPWAAAMDALTYINDRMANDTESRRLFHDYMVERLDPAYTQVNGVQLSPDDPFRLRRLRTLVLRWACLFGHIKCNADESSLFRDWQAQADPDKTNPIAPDLKSSTYCSGMRTGGVFDYEFLITRYVNAPLLAKEQALLISALGCSSQPVLLQQYLDESISETSRLKASDARSAHSAVYANHVGVDIALDFVIVNWQRCAVVYGGEGSLGRAFTGIAPKLNTQEHYNKLRDFRDQSGLSPGLVASVNSAMATLQQSLEWQEAHRAAVIDYFLQPKITLH